MSEIDEKTYDYQNHKSAAEMAFSIQDYPTAYQNYIACYDLANDIANLTLEKEASEKYTSLAQKDEEKAQEILSKLHMSKEEADKLTNRKRPKGFDKFIGEDKIKEYVTREVIEPWKNHNMKSRKKSAILLYGPEGVSKKVFIQSFIHELHATPYYINPIANFSPYSENTKANFQRLFKMAEEKDNVVFYFTKPVAFFPKEDNDESKATAKIFLKLLKKELKRVRKKNLNILFIASTPAMDKMTMKAFQKGMFDDLLRVHHPDRHTRRGMMEERLKGIVFENENEIDKLVEFTHGFVSKEISRLCRRIVSTSHLYAKDGKDAIITADMMKRIIADLGPVDDLEFKKNVDAFEASLGKDISIINDNHD